MPTALVFGETLIDEYPGDRVPAGAPLHIAAHLAVLGWRAMLVTRVGYDPDGKTIVATAASHGVDTSLVELDPDLPTGVTVIEVDGPDHRFQVLHPAAWDAVVGPDPVPPHDALIFGTLPLRDARGASALWRLMAASTGLIVLDANLRHPWVDLHEVRRLIARVGLLKMNHDEAAALGDLPSGPDWVCVTNGSDGAGLRHRDGREWRVPGIPARIVDAVGAGDAFLAALVDGLIRDDDPLEILIRANQLAAASVTRRGGLPG